MQIKQRTTGQARLVLVAHRVGLGIESFNSASRSAERTMRLSDRVRGRRFIIVSARVVNERRRSLGCRAKRRSSRGGGAGVLGHVARRLNLLLLSGRDQCIDGFVLLRHVYFVDECFGGVTRQGPFHRSVFGSGDFPRPSGFETV